MSERDTSAPASRPGRSVLTIDPRELRNRIGLTLDRELIGAIDERRRSSWPLCATIRARR